MKENIKTFIQSGLFLAGTAVFAITQWLALSSNMKLWWLMVVIVIEGQLAVWLIAEEKRDSRTSFWQSLLPATLPLIVLVAAFLKAIGSMNHTGMQ